MLNSKQVSIMKNVKMENFQKPQNQLKDNTSFLSVMIGASLIMCVMLMASCKKEKEPEPERYLTVEPATVEFMNAGGKQTVTVTSNIEGWTFNVDATWVTAAKTSDGNGIELTAIANPDNAERKTSLNITAGKYTEENKVIEVKQGPTHLTVTPAETVELQSGAVESVVTVMTNVESWDFTLGENNWVTATKISTGIRLTAQANPVTAPRSVSLRIFAEKYGLEKVVTVTQDGAKYLDVDPEGTVDVEAIGGVVEVTVNTDVETWNFTLEENDWVTAAKTETGVELTAQENPNTEPRSVNLRIYAQGEGLEQNLTVTQRAAPIISLISPVASLNIDVNAAITFPITFSWEKVTGVTGYVLKISNNAAFPETSTRTIEVGDVSSYVLNSDEGLAIINSFIRERQLTFLWTVTPISDDVYVKTQARTIIANRTPAIVGQWLFDNAANLGEATIGQDLIPVGSGFSPVTGTTATGEAVKAAKVDKGSYYKCLHGFAHGSDFWTLRFNFRFSESNVFHSLLQTSPTNNTGMTLYLLENGVVRLEDVGNMNNMYAVGPDMWHEVVLVSNRTQKMGYVDGELLYTWSSNNVRYQLNGEGLLFFADNADRDNDIEIADITLWDLDLTENELLSGMGMRKLSRSGWSIPAHSGTRTPGGPADIVENMIDNDLTSNWCGVQNQPTWAVVDLGSSVNIRRIVANATNWGGANPKTVQVLVGDSPDPDGTWTLAGEVVRGGASAYPWGIAMLLYDSETPVTSRYIKINMPDNYGGYAALSQLTVFEQVSN